MAARLSAPLFVGRERELETLVRAMTRAPALTVVEGEAGVGKSRLVQEALRQPMTAGRRRLIGRCHLLRKPFPLGPVLEGVGRSAGLPARAPLSPLVGSLRPLLPEWAEHLPPDMAPLGDARAQRHRVFRALRELLSSLGPTVFVLEDLHWAEDDTVEFLRFLLADMPQELALVLTYRPREFDPSSGAGDLGDRRGFRTARATIELSPLRPEAVRRLVAAILDTEDVSQELGDLLHERTAGLPFAVEEVIKLLQDRRDLVRLEGGWARRELHRLDVPAAVRDSVLARLAGLTEGARAACEAVAVLQEPASEPSIGLLSALSSSGLRDALSEALTCVLIEEVDPGLYSCRHSLAAQAISEAVPGPRRRELHRLAARSLEATSPRPLAQLAYHYRRAGQHLAWATSAEGAADEAMASGDDRGASRLLLEALGVPGLGRAARVRVATKLGQAALYGSVHGPSIEALRQVLRDEAASPAQRGRLRFALARLLMDAGKTSSSRCELRVAVHELSDEPDLAARAMINLALPGGAGSCVEENLAWLDRAMALTSEATDPAIATAVLAWRAAVLLYLGDPAGWDALRHIPAWTDSQEQGIELLRGSQHHAAAALLLGRYEQAEDFLGQAERLRSSLGLARWLPWLETIRVALRWRRGEWMGLEADAERLLEATQETPLRALTNRVVLGSVALSSGDLRKAKNLLEDALNRSETIGSLGGLSASLTALSRLAHGRGDHGRALELATRGREVVRSKGTWVWADGLGPAGVQAMLACGRAEEAKGFVSEMDQGLLGRDAPAAHASLVVSRGLLAEAADEHEQASDLFGRAERAWSELPRPYEAAQAAELRAGSLLRVDGKGAAALLQRSLEAFANLGASWDAARVRHTLRSHGLPLPWRGGRRGYGNSLSPRELEVARLAAGGQSNREIAATLYLSPRTVEDHVAAALRKLGVSSRKRLVVPQG